MPMPEQAYTPFQQSMNYLNQAADMTKSAVSPESRDRAAGRVRASLSQERLSNDNTIMDQEAARGTANSGRADARRSQNTGNYFQALGEGLGKVESDYTQQNLTAGSNLGTLGAAGMSGAVANQNAKNNALNQYLQGGNLFQDPTGESAKNFWNQFGVDVNGMSFFGGTGTVNPVSPTGGSAGGGTNTPGGTANPSPSSFIKPDGTIDWGGYGKSLINNFDLSRPIYYDPATVSANPGYQQILQMYQTMGLNPIAQATNPQSGNTGKTFYQN